MPRNHNPTITIEQISEVPADAYDLDGIQNSVKKQFGVDITHEQASKLASQHATAGYEQLSYIRPNHDDASIYRMYHDAHSRFLELEDPDPYYDYWADVADTIIGTEPTNPPDTGYGKGEVLYYILHDAAPIKNDHICEFAVDVEFNTGENTN